MELFGIAVDTLLCKRLVTSFKAKKAHRKVNWTRLPLTKPG